ncbi:hypothetical protein ACOSQ3_004239 [Xanthoceras sorbifolium]
MTTIFSADKDPSCLSSLSLLSHPFEPSHSLGLKQVYTSTSTSITTFKFPKANGRVPIREFDEKLMCKISLRFQKEGGITELNPLELNESVLRLVILPKHGGIARESLLFPKKRPWSCFNFPSVAGIDPVNSFPPKLNIIKFFKLPISWGILPLILQESK